MLLAIISVIQGDVKGQEYKGSDVTDLFGLIGFIKRIT